MYLGEIPVQFLHPFLAHWVVCLFVVELYIVNGLPQWLSGKESACNAGDTGDERVILSYILTIFFLWRVTPLFPIWSLKLHVLYVFPISFLFNILIRGL